VCVFGDAQVSSFFAETLDPLHRFSHTCFLRYTATLPRWRFRYSSEVVPSYHRQSFVLYSHSQRPSAGSEDELKEAE